MKRYELEAKNKDELREHADVAGIKWASDDTKGTLIDRIMGDLPAAEVTATGATATVKKQTDARDIPLGALYDLKGNKINGKKVRLTIFATEADKSDVDIIVNGNNIRVQRGKEVIVDEAYAGVLKDAMINTVVQDPDSGVRTPQQIQVYPHTVSPV